jgi:replicative DNA helicase
MTLPPFQAGEPGEGAAGLPSTPLPDRPVVLKRLDSDKEENQLLHLLVDDPEAVLRLRRFPQTSWFSSAGRHRVHLAWRQLFDRQLPITADAVYRTMHEHARPDEFGLVEQTFQAVLNAPITDKPENLVIALRDAARCRRFSALINESNVGLHRNQSIDELWGRAMQVLADDEEHENFRPFQEQLDDTLAQVLTPDPRRVGMLTGLKQFDALTGGIKSEKNIVIAGMQGMGKTAVYLEIESRILFSYPDAAVLVLSLEMSQEALQKRKLANLSYVDVRRQEDWSQPGQTPLSQAEATRLRAARERMRSWEDRIEIHYRPMDPQEMLATMRKFAFKHRGKRLIVICDHLGMVRRKAGSDVRVGIMNAVQALKDGSTEYGYCAIHLAQMVKELENKAKHGASFHKPDQSMIAESGFINQVADSVFSLWRPEVYTPEIITESGAFDTKGKLFFINGKMRDGARNEDPLLGCNMRFYQIYNLEDAHKYHYGMAA